MAANHAHSSDFSFSGLARSVPLVRVPILIEPETPDFYDFAHRVYRDCKDWGHDPVLGTSDSIAPHFKVYLKVRYDDGRGIGVHYHSDRKDGIIYPGPTLKHLERLLYEEAIMIYNSKNQYP